MASISQTGIPAWEQSALTLLANQGKTYGVPAVDLALIDREESTGQGGGLNPQGYGGFFGLGVGQAGAPLLQSTSIASFNAQASLAALDFSKALSVSGGNPVTAENYYQTGKLGTSSGGAALFSEFLNGLKIAPAAGGGGGTPAQTTAASAPAPTTNSGGLDGFIRGIDGVLNPGKYQNLLGTVGDILSLGTTGAVATFVGRAMVGVAGFIVMYAGFKSLTSGKSPVTTIINTPAAVAGKAADLGRKGVETAGLAATAA